MNQQFGKLYLVPAVLGTTTAEKVIPSGTLEIVRTLRFFVVENVRTARRMLSKMHMPCPIEELTFVELDKHNPQNPDLMTYLGEALNGNDIGLMSEAGTPCVADPGALIVELAHQAGIQVVPLTGPNAMILALMASGFNGQSFCFHGYLPIKNPERVQMIKSLERQSFANDETELFIETPFRNNAMIEELVKTCHPSTMLCVASNITMDDEKIVSKPISEWKSIKYDWNKKPAVFLIYSDKNRKRY
ncbi:MAG: SAM-dependent methyltransferase [Bacteroidales bacterium]|nr:SAM-dependent methyltransferase [Bacteroidales bacterium]